jgi:TRAP-type mannitol/chloroaromatic compound transport system substrate-binding protein
VNKAAWEGLPAQFKSAIEVASHESYTTMLADYDTNNMLAMRRLLGNGVEVKPFPKDFMEAAYKETFKMYEEDQKQNPDFAKIYGPWLDFREKIINWFRTSEGSYEFFVYNQRKS